MLASKDIADILDENDFTLLNQFTTGNSESAVFLVRSKEEKKVVKLPTSQRSLDEITSNISAYRTIHEWGCEDILPPYLEIRSYKGMPYIVMSYLGEDFETKIKRSKNPLGMYESLCGPLERLYRITIRGNGGGNKFLALVRNEIFRNFEQFLIPSGLSSSKYLERIKSIDFSDDDYLITCFSPYDFTPEDIFISNSGFFYPDPKQECKGLPQISLACFAGVSRDAYGLPESVTGYKILEKFAVKTCSEIVDISISSAERLFLFGRALQCSFSSRVRIYGDKEKASYFAKESERHLDLL